MDAGKSFAVTLASGLDRLVFIAEQTKSGVRVFGQYTERAEQTVDGKTKIVVTKGPERGAHDNVADMDKAKAWIETKVAESLAAGWTRSERKAFQRKPPAFTASNLPAPRAKATAPAPAAPAAPAAPRATAPVAPRPAQARTK